MELFKKKKKKNTEEKEQTWKDEERKPPDLVRTIDLNDGTVRVEMLIRGLEPGKDKFNPKSGKADLAFMKGGFGFNMETVLEDHVAKTKTWWTFNVQKLPTKINIEESKWDLEKGKIVVTMTKDSKCKDVDWESLVFAKGLDQKSSSSSDDST